MSELADRVRSQRQLWAASGSSHDRVIALLRILLPAAIGVLVVLLALAPLTVGRDISFVLSKDRVEVARERMRVSAATYRGQDSKGQPFQLTAGSAVQVSSRDAVVRLKTLAAQIQLPEGPARIIAGQGRYDMDSEKVAIDGPVRFRSADGYNIDTRDVGIDLKTRQVASEGPVDGRMNIGRFSGDRFTADLNKRVVVLEGRARLHIDQRQARAAPRRPGVGG
ncbi:LPS export ABC transporter periplasmic protein LptC [Sphingomonadaceae bacterium G21617-S1]|jgi:lipopolysaccharide export system protein LptC|uniref:LPS export ABC transporter periplasmic protein LptC n=1 Tax=Rhizorhabdus sp. TaxID=1968843 RepID=UPI0019C0664D|nr:LPS export ABC transporter periplasmic protein LptC [Rhizorhabdus sp.]MBD3760729.1 LPS export ABC transporter periplasmic protein LptC [Rhizorhabdus sp.]MCZ4341730.1 LPS export ABC transporter periplasmic protein LptC [Sphingomonadaceae bacterium G21617-S1]